MNSDKKQYNLLIVDDEPHIIEALRRVFRENDYQLFTAENGEQAIEILKAEEIQVILSDQRMPKMSGSEFLAIARALKPDAIRIILSGHADFEMLADAVNHAVIHRYIPKPWKINDLRRVISNAFNTYFRTASNRRVVEYFTHTKNAMAVTDRNMYILKANPALLAATDQSEASIIGTNLRQIVDETAADLICGNLNTERPAEEIPINIIECQLINQQDTCNIYSLSITCTTDYVSNQSTYVLTFNDISKQKREQEAFEYAAYHDQLTGLCNRRLFLEKCDKAISLASEKNWHLAILFFDLDKFKLINDTHGHKAGDVVLTNVASRLTETLRSEDTVSRFGGDEFVALIPYLSSPEKIGDIANRLLANLQVPVSFEGVELPVNSSIGISIFPGAGETPDDLIANADQALYAAKNAGRGQFHIYKP